MEPTRPPGFPGTPPARMPRAPTPARSPPPRPLRRGEMTFRPHDVGGPLALNAFRGSITRPTGSLRPLAGVALRRRVASSLPGCTRSRARGVLVFGGVGLPRRCVCHDRGPVRIGGPCVSRGAQAGGVRPLPPPATRRCRGAVRLYAVPRRTRRRGDAVRGAAGAAVWGRRRAGTACACCAR